MSQAGFSINEILQVSQGEFIAEKGDASPFSASYGICTDSRRLKKGDLFVALKGKKFDGHSFIREARKKGACGAIVSEPVLLPSSHFFLIRVKDTLFTLQEIARYHRERLSPCLIGITGSNGKTTVKEMVWQILSSRYPTLKSEGNFNNQIGVPLSLLRLSPFHKWAVLEMGMNSRGEIGRLAEITQPNIGVITNIHHSHIGFLGSLEEIKEAKAELIPWLNKDREKWLVLNGDDDHTWQLRKKARCRVITFGIKSQADVKAGKIVTNRKRISFTLVYGKNKIPIFIPIPGSYNVYNALAASAVFLVLNIPFSAIVQSLASFKLPPMHSNISILDNYELIDDSYNANPESMEETLKLLQSREGQRKIAILGDMLELGNRAKLFHYRVGKRAGELGIDALFALGEFSQDLARGAREEGMMNAFFFRDKERLIEKLLSYFKKGDCLLIKGSRGMKMEEIVKELKERLCSTS